MLRLLGNCPTIRELNNHVAEQLLRRVIELGVEARIGKRFISDAEVVKKVGYLGIESPILNMDSKCLTHRRACWLNGEGAQQVRRQKMERLAMEAAANAAPARSGTSANAARLILVLTGWGGDNAVFLVVQLKLVLITHVRKGWLSI